MGMPIDLVLVRHGESEGNIAHSLSGKGNHKHFTNEFKSRHSSEWRLTDLGRRQARIAGKWIKKNIGSTFDKAYTSEHLRTLETAALLGLDIDFWRREILLVERSYGGLELMNHEEGFKKRTQLNQFYDPPSCCGESMAKKCVEIEFFLSKLFYKCAEQKVIVVCHGEVMWCFRVCIEHLTQEQFNQLFNSKNPHDRIYNSQTIHYSRQNPFNGLIAPHLQWMRSVCPTDLKLSRNRWEKIKFPNCSNKELLKLVKKYPRIIK